MATRPKSQASGKKPRTIDLEAKEVKDTEPSTSANSPKTAGKTVASQGSPEQVAKKIAPKKESVPATTPAGKTKPGERQKAGDTTFAADQPKPMAPVSASASSTSSKSNTTGSASGKAEKASDASMGKDQKDAGAKTGDDRLSSASDSFANGSAMDGSSNGGGGGGSTITGAILGALLAILGLGGIGQMENAATLPFIGALYGGNGVSTGDSQGVGGGDGSTLEGLQAQLVDLERRLDERPQGNSGGVSLGAVNRLQQLRSQIAGLDQNLTGLSQEVSQLKEAREAEPDSDNGGAIDQAFAQVQARLSELEQSVSEQTTADTAIPGSETMDALRQRLDQLETSIKTQPQELASAQALDGLRETLASSRTTLEEIRATVQDNSEARDELERSLETLKTQTETLSTQLDGARTSEVAARVVAANALSTALERDGDLRVPLASIEALIGGDVENISKLKSLAQDGIPTLGALKQGFEAFRQRANAQLAPKDDGSVAGRFWSNARKLVTVRSSGPREGDSPGAVLSRMKAGMEKGDLRAVRSQWSALPENIQTLGQDFIVQLEERIEAQGLYESIAADLGGEAQ